MKRRYIGALAAALVAAAVTGCSGNSETAPKETQTGAENGKMEGTEITVMVPDWGNPGEELLSQFTEETGIHVVVNEVSWDDIRDKIAIAAVGGKAAADVFEVDWSWVGEMNSAGWLEPIEMSQADQEDIPSMETFMIDGTVWAVPYANDYRIAYYNKEHFAQAGIDKAPETWDEVYEAMKAIKAQGITEYPYAMPMNADESATTSMMWMAFAKNGMVFNDDNTLNEESVVDALTFENQMVQEGYTDPAIKTATGMDVYRKITSGEASFMVGPTKFVGFSSDPAECSVVGQVIPIMLPGKDGVSKQTMPLPEAIGVSSYSENKEAAIEFVKWYSSPETQKALYAANGSIPTRNSVLESLIEDGTIKNSGAMLDMAKIIKSPFPNGVPDYYAEMSNTIFNNINRMVLGEQTPEKAFEAMNEKVSELAK